MKNAKSILILLLVLSLCLTACLAPKDAAIELERCVKELGFAGVMLSGHYQDLPSDDPFYLPIFEKAQELDVPVYLHPGMIRRGCCECIL